MPTIRPVPPLCHACLHGPVLTVGLRPKPESRPRSSSVFAASKPSCCTAGNDTAPVRTQMIGDHHVFNCLWRRPSVWPMASICPRSCAAGSRARCARPAGTDRMRPAVRRVCRLCPYARRSGRVLDTLRQVTAGRLICVFGAGGNRDADKRPLMGRAVEPSGPTWQSSPTITHGTKTAGGSLTRAFRLHQAAACRMSFSTVAGLSTGLRSGPHRRLCADCRQRTRGPTNRRSRTAPLDDREVARRWLYNVATECPSIWDGPSRMTLSNC